MIIVNDTIRQLSMLLLIATTLYSATDSNANQPTGWEFDITAGLNASATYYNDHWQGGELSTVTWVSRVQGTAERQFTRQLDWRNTLEIAFGQTILQKEGPGPEPVWSPPQKSTDLIDYESLLRFTLQTWIDPYLGLRIISGFLDTRDPANERYFNPVEMTESAGGSRSILKQDRIALTARAGVAVRQTIDRDKAQVSSASPGITYETDIVNDGGLELVAELRTSTPKKILELKSDLKIYEALISTEASESDSSYWRYPDINWENTLIINAAKYLMINLYAQALYDRQINPDVRLKSTLGIGVTFQFGEAGEN